MKSQQKSTGQLVEEAFAKLGCKRLRIEPAPLPKSAKRKRCTKPSGNGSKK